jgi:phenylalanyl-tRNA synthetase beta chain
MFLSNFGYSELSFEQSKKTNVYFHPTRSVTIKHNNKVLGRFGELNPKIRSLESSKLPIYVFDFNLSHFKNYRMKHEIRVAKEYSKYPSITKDLSFSINKNENLTNLKTYIQTSTKMLKSLEFFDVYINPEKVDQKVNIAIRLEFQSATETLTNEFIEKEIILLKTGMNQIFHTQFNE